MPFETEFNAIVEEFTPRQGVEPGRMMSSPALTVGGKVFCFFNGEQMVFKLGKEADRSRPELDGASYLSPFKTKPPMTAWLCVPFQSRDQWSRLAEEARSVVAG
jgi:hypothetical protein